MIVPKLCSDTGFEIQVENKHDIALSDLTLLVQLVELLGQL